MSDSRGQARALTLLTPVAANRKDALAADLAALPDGADSPLAKLPGTHFARLVILDGVEPGTRYLVFTACFDGKLEPYLLAICERIPETADRIWGACDGYPGCANRQQFVRWVKVNRVPTSAFTGGYLDASLAELHEAVKLRDWLRDFALTARGMSAAELRAAFQEQYPG